MAGFSSVTSLESVVFAQNASFDGTERGGLMTTDGQLWIGAMASPHVKLGTLTSPDGSITIGYSSPNITLQVNGGAPYYSLTPYIVGTDTHSQYATIAAAIAQAITDGASLSNPKNIHIKPKGSDYTENFSVVDGINLIGQGDQTAISGKISMSTAGEASISNLTLKTNGDFCISMTGSAASELVIYNCNIHATNNTAISQTSSNAASIIPINDSFFFIENTGIAPWVSSSAGFISIANSSSGNTGSSTTQASNSSGNVQIFDCVFDFPISSSGTGSVNIVGGITSCALLNVTALTLNGTSGNSVTQSIIAGGTASAMSVGAGSTTTAQFLSAASSNTNVITGAGTLQYSFISFSGASSGHNVTTETALNTLI